MRKVLILGIGLLVSSPLLAQQAVTRPIPFEMIERAPRSDPWYLRVMARAGYEISARLTTRDESVFFGPDQMREMAQFLNGLSPVEPRSILLQVRVPRGPEAPPLVFDFEADSLETITGAVLTTHIAYLALFADKLPAAEVRFSLSEGRPIEDSGFDR